AAWLAMGHAFPAATSQLTSSLASLGLSPAAQMSILLPAGLAAYAWLVVGRYSHWLEHDADLATSISPEGVVDLAGTDDFELALRKVAGRGESRWSAWLHPTVNDRVRLLRAATRDPRLAARLRWRMRLVAWLIVALYGLLAVGVLAVSA
ncbi:MAG: hypothetical protein SFU86_13090, partial [Pirellulaceae bacterium]|nr:hypothetical protein [Pirellulaceae bacterium]